MAFEKGLKTSISLKKLQHETKLYVNSCPCPDSDKTPFFKKESLLKNANRSVLLLHA